ncbi:hypothetical protein BDA99DRAFT_314596 [Phascolomyces articulosus]|uniref:Uncharacterized protein n=1 Tax=Phascolomyces articulosus TaxID=60185 RepID=A0AAD5JZ86_9FUNG|nr:hypothetical protein BDA99DRAFT_314596 [Phascolomyces articulosus]
MSSWFSKNYLMTLVRFSRYCFGSWIQIIVEIPTDVFFLPRITDISSSQSRRKPIEKRITMVAIPREREKKKIQINAISIQEFIASIEGSLYSYLFQTELTLEGCLCRSCRYSNDGCHVTRVPSSFIITCQVRIQFQNKLLLQNDSEFMGKGIDSAPKFYFDIFRAIDFPRVAR